MTEEEKSDFITRFIQDEVEHVEFLTVIEVLGDAGFEDEDLAREIHDRILAARITVLEDR